MGISDGKMMDSFHEVQRQFGTIVREHRKRLGWKQKEFAARIPMTQSKISMVETGARLVKVDTMERILSVLGKKIVFSIEERE